MELKGDLYFEIAEQCVPLKLPARYIFMANVGGKPLYSRELRNCMLFSNRVWEDNNGTIRYVKHRYTGDLTTPVDLKEFMWIKLKSTDSRNLVIG